MQPWILFEFISTWLNFHFRDMTLQLITGHWVFWCTSYWQAVPRSLALTPWKLTTLSWRVSTWLNSQERLPGMLITSSRSYASKGKRFLFWNGLNPHTFFVFVLCVWNDQEIFSYLMLDKYFSWSKLLKLLSMLNWVFWFHFRVIEIWIRSSELIILVPCQLVLMLTLCFSSYVRKLKCKVNFVYMKLYRPSWFLNYFKPSNFLLVYFSMSFVSK